MGRVYGTGFPRLRQDFTATSTFMVEEEGGKGFAIGNFTKF
jgi:hypothetical protein